MVVQAVPLGRGWYLFAWGGTRICALSIFRDCRSIYLALGGLSSTPFRSFLCIRETAESWLERWRLAAEYTACDM
jgi:hypothetical protein